jgi:hypothetical protein
VLDDRPDWAEIRRRLKPGQIILDAYGEGRAFMGGDRRYIGGC